MPVPKPPTAIEADSFTMAANPDAIPGVQANETFMLTGAHGGALGKGGERVGFAKYQFDGQKFDAVTKESLALPEKRSNALRSGNGLNEALTRLQAGEGTQEAVDSKLASAVAELKKNLPRDQRAGVDAMAPQEVAANLLQVAASLDARNAQLITAVDAFEKVAIAASDLFDPQGTTPPDRALLARSVASSQVDQLLGTNCVAEETFGVAEDGRVVGVSIQGDGAGVTGKYRFNEGEEKKDYVLDVDLKNPQIQRGLADLEAVDYLTGQIDRHCGNMFIDHETKKVTGIDNDLAFPERSREQTLARMGAATAAKSVAGMPQQMHQETAQKILALSPDALRQTLSEMPTPDNVGKLSEAAIDGACARLVEMQNALKQPGGPIQVVAEFNDATYEQAMAAQEAVVQQKLGTSLADTNVEQDGDLEKVPKTSYLGSVAVQTQRYKVGALVEPEKFGVRPFETATKAPRNAEAAIYAEQLDMAKKTLANNPASLGELGQGPAQQQAEALHQDIKALKEKIAHYDKEMAGLEKHKVGSMLRSLASGGSSGRKEFYADKKLDAQQQIGNLQRQLEGIAENAMTDEFKADLRADAKVAAARLAPPQPVAQNNAVQPALNALPQNAEDELDVSDHDEDVEVNVDVAVNQPVVAQNDVAEQNNGVEEQPAFLGEQAPVPPGMEYLNEQAPVPPQPQVNNGPVLPQNAEDELDVVDVDDLDDDEPKVEVEAKKEGLKKSPSVAEMLKRTNSAPQLGALHQGQGAEGVGGQGQDAKPNSLRASWQSAKPKGPAQPVGALTRSKP